jgi:aldehyde:ferredoxin oxidoreductase
MSALTTSFEDLPEEWTAIGGRGLSAKILNKEVPPETDPLGPEAKLVIAIGPLAGSMAPSFGRISVGAKSPLTLGIKESNSGGPAGQKLDRLGIRAIIVEGSPKDGALHVVRITKDGVSFEEGSSYRGMGNYELVEALGKQGNEKASVISVGIAGERKQKAASVAFTDKDGRPSRHAGRGGLGAVMGSRGLKAIVVDETGTSQIEFGDKGKFRAVSKGWSTRLNGENNSMSKFGTTGGIAALSRISSMPSKNYSGEPTENIENIHGETIRETNLERGGKMDRCMPGCIIQCSIILHGEDGKHFTSGIEYETFGLLGSNLGIASIDATARFERQCDDMGFDTIELGSALGMAGGAGKFAFGDIEAVDKLFDEIRQGTEFGLILGDGVVATANSLGVDRIPAFKGQAIPAHDPRVGKPTGVTYATSPMGADHTAGMKYEMDDEGAVEHSLREQIAMSLVDTLGLCNFAMSGDRKALLALLADLLDAQYGLKLTEDEIVDLGKQTLRDELRFNAAAGFNTIHEPLPSFVRTESLPPKGKVFGVPQAELDAIFDNLDTATIV